MTNRITHDGKGSSRPTERTELTPIAVVDSRQSRTTQHATHPAGPMAFDSFPDAFCFETLFPIGPSARHLFKLIPCKPDGSSIPHRATCGNLQGALRFPVESDADRMGWQPWLLFTPPVPPECQRMVIMAHYTNWAWTLKRLRNDYQTRRIMEAEMHPWSSTCCLRFHFNIWYTGKYYLLPFYRDIKLYNSLDRPEILNMLGEYRNAFYKAYFMTTKRIS